MELTGIPALDRHLADYATWKPIARFRDPAFAEDSCELVSTHLVDHLREHGFDRPGYEAYLSGDEWDGDVMVLERVSPDDFGYADRPVPGNNSHVVCLFDAGEHLYSIDFTAAQYGYREFPLVQRLDQRTPGAQWEREWAIAPELETLEQPGSASVSSASPALGL